MTRVEIRGTEQLTRVARSLRDHADGGALKRRMLRGFRDEAAVITVEQRANLGARLPHRGGLAAAVAGDGRFSLRTSLAGKTASVSIRDSWQGHDMKAIDSGLIRHPVFDEQRLRLSSKGELESAWVSQRVPAGLASGPFNARRNNLRSKVLRSISEVAREIARET